MVLALLEHRHPLGEDLRLVLLSVTEGEDKPLKYPTIFNSADAAVITKGDLAVAVDFDEVTALANIQAVRPAMPAFLVSSKTGQGLSNYLQFLTATLHAKLHVPADEASSHAEIHSGTSR